MGVTTIGLDDFDRVRSGKGGNPFGNLKVLSFLPPRMSICALAAHFPASSRSPGLVAQWAEEAYHEGHETPLYPRLARTGNGLPAICAQSEGRVGVRLVCDCQ